MIATLLRAGTRVKINITEPEGYTQDLYKSIQGQEGIVLRHQGKLSSYDNAYLIEFSNKATRKYATTSNGKWSRTNLESKMAWWTESKYLKVIN
jgi:hypothetical protein